MNQSLMTAKECIRNRVLETLKTLHEKEYKATPEYSYLLSACLRRDGQFKAWVALFDDVLSELEDSGQIAKEYVYAGKDALNLPPVVETYRLTKCSPQ